MQRFASRWGTPGSPLQRRDHKWSWPLCYLSPTNADHKHTNLTKMTTPSNPAARRKGVLLTAADAILIYLLRPKRCPTTNMFLADSAPSPTTLAQQYKVASKTIRDIWNRVTWSQATRPYWNDLEVAASAALREGKEGDAAIAQIRRPGRPQGARDAVPRKKKTELDSVPATPTTVLPTDAARPFWPATLSVAPGSFGHVSWPSPVQVPNIANPLFEGVVMKSEFARVVEVEEEKAGRDVTFRAFSNGARQPPLESSQEQCARFVDILPDNDFLLQQQSGGDPFRFDWEVVQYRLQAMQPTV